MWPLDNKLPRLSKFLASHHYPRTMGTLPGRQAERAGEGRKRNGEGDVGEGDLLLPLLLLPATISMAESSSSTSFQGYSPAWGQQRAFFRPRSISGFANLSGSSHPGACQAQCLLLGLLQRTLPGLLSILVGLMTPTCLSWLHLAVCRWRFVIRNSTLPWLD